MESNKSWQQQQQQQQQQQLGGEECVMEPEQDTSGVPYPKQSFKIVTSSEVAGKVSITSVVMLLALIGNCLVVATVWRCRRLRTPTNVYIVSLAVSDLMVTLSCTWVHLAVRRLPSCTWVHLVDNLTDGWVLGAFFCVFNTFAQGYNQHHIV